jgi:hypothetical protein
MHVSRNFRGHTKKPHIIKLNNKKNLSADK